MTIIQYPLSLPIASIITSRASDVYLPTYPHYKDTPLLYHFYDSSNGRSLYVGKTTIGRPRLRWHLSNTFIPGEIVDSLTLDILQLTRAIADDGFHYVALVVYEADLIRAMLPAYNVNIKKTFRRAHALEVEAANERATKEWQARKARLLDHSDQ